MTADGLFRAVPASAEVRPLQYFLLFLRPLHRHRLVFFPGLLLLSSCFSSAETGLDDWLILAALAGGILIYIVLMPDNYGGGGGSLANRYFLNIYPFFFSCRREDKSWADRRRLGRGRHLHRPDPVAPFRASAHPATHAKRLPFNAAARRDDADQQLSDQHQSRCVPRSTSGTTLRYEDRFLYFLDDNFNPSSGADGMWTRGDRTCEFILRTYYPVKEVDVKLLNNPRQRQRDHGHGRGPDPEDHPRAKLRGTLRFPVGNGFQDQSSSIITGSRSRPTRAPPPTMKTEPSKERRCLGVFF